MALAGLTDDFCIAFIDDIFIYSRVREDYEGHVKAVLDRLRQYKLYVKLSKCAFGVEYVNFLGF